ncbi:MAG TPA: hypothetical protein VFB20_11955 [Burkholderiales bacterium]|nr:hypothetical protein [Burkholderiales bacterium]
MHLHRGLTPNATPREPPRSIFYRYLFFDWLFRDAPRRSFYERAAAWRYNKQMRRYLGVYLLRWLILFGLAYTLGAVFETRFGWIYLARLWYAGSCVAATMFFLIVCSWLMLRYG